MRVFQAAKVPRPRGVKQFSIESVPAHLRLDVEIGCGVGMHPIKYVRTHQDRYLVAIEHTRIKYEKFAGRLAHHEKLERLLPVHADAVEWITHFLPPSSVDRYLILYPNPEPKRESARWYAMPFMEKLKETLKPGGELILATNKEYYAEGARHFMKEVWGFRLESDQLVDFEPRTHFEKKYRSRNEVCWNLLFRKN